MNVLVVSPTYAPFAGGAEVLFADLVRLLVREGHRVTVVARAEEGPDVEEERDGARVVRWWFPFPRLSSLNSIRASEDLHRRFAALAAETGAEVLVLARVEDRLARYPVRLARRTGLPLVVYLHGGEVRSASRTSRSHRRALRSALRACRAAVAVSADLATEAARFVPRAAGRVAVVPCAVDAARVAAAPPAGPPGRWLLFVGRLEPVKNVDLLLEAFARARADLGGTGLVLAGTGSLGPALAARARALGIDGDVTFLGTVDRATAWGLMNRAAAVVLPSRAEGHPIVLLEALAAGAPIVATDVKGNRDVLADPAAGRLVPQGDPDALAAALVDAANAPETERVSRLPREWTWEARWPDHRALLDPRGPGRLPPRPRGGTARA